MGRRIASRRGIRSRLLVLVTFLASMVGTTTEAEAQPGGPGVVEGRVVDAASGEPLPGAQVVVTGVAAETSTDRDGRFRLAVPAGPHSVVITYLGRKDEVVETTVIAGGTQRLDVKMSMVAYEESVTVTAEALILDSQARALNQQKTAPNITNIVSADQIGSFPDRNAAETTQRIPGVSITKDQGEGRYVNVRGTEPRLNSMMIDGQRIPSPDPLIRQVAVDVVPSELLQAIEVSKALTPDQDGDSIGGSVNLVMKQAPEKFRLYGTAGGGYNSLLSDWGQSNFSATMGRRFAGGKNGVIVSASGSQTTRGNQDVEVVYTPLLTLNELNPRWYQVYRKRAGFTGAFDAKQGNNGTFTIRGVFNRFIDDHENRQRVRYAVANRRIDHELRDRTHIERITSLSVSGNRVLGNGRTTFDYQAFGAYSDQTDPLTTTTVFRHTNVNFLPNVTPTSIDPDNVQANPQNEVLANYNFNSQLLAVNFSKDRDLVGQVNGRTALSSSAGSTSLLKFGVKFRDKQKGRNRNESTFTTSSTLKLTNYLETGFDLPPYLDGRYNLEPYTSQSLVAPIPNQVPGTLTRNHARDAEEFDGTERVTGLYAMGEIYAGPKLFLLPGVRYEYTTDDFTGRNVRFSPSGAWLGTDPLQSKTNYGTFMPAFHVRYAATPNTNLRFAVTRTLARPNYYDTIPYRSQNDSDLTVTQGNADLKPTTSWNVDLLGEHYLRSVGVLSAGFFYKRLKDYIYIYTLQEQINGVQYQVTQPLNGDAASIRGVEVALQNQLRFLPPPFNGIGVYANYTFSDSTAHFPNHQGDTSLPGQSQHVGNVAVSFEKSGFMGRASVNFHGSYIDIVGANNLQDRFYDTNSQFDLSITQRITRNIRGYFDALNLNDALLRYYQGVPDRVLQEEHYQWTLNFGVKLEF
jgi:TonB-dependent receptor